MATTGYLLQRNLPAGAFPSKNTFCRSSLISLHSSFSPFTRPIVNLNRACGRSPRVRIIVPLKVSRRMYGYPQENGLVRGGAFDTLAFEEDIGEEDVEDEEEEDRSLDLLVQFVHTVFRKISRRASRSVRSMLPRSVPSKLVRFSVNGTIILAFLWILKAFLQVICTLGTIVFVCILAIRGVLAAVMYQRVYRSKFGNMDEEDSIWSGAQPAT